MLKTCEPIILCDRTLKSTLLHKYRERTINHKKFINLLFHLFIFKSLQTFRHFNHYFNRMNGWFKGRTDQFTVKLFSFGIFSMRRWDHFLYVSLFIAPIYMVKACTKGYNWSLSCLGCCNINTYRLQFYVYITI